MRRHRPSVALGALLALLLALLPGRGVAADQAAEYDLKAVFLYNFTLFTTWPDAAFADAQAPLAICVLGPNPFGGSLEEVVHGERVNGRPLVVRHLAAPAGAGNCQVLFLSRQQDPAVLAQVPGVASGLVLTVGEADGFLEAGGMLRFVTRQGRIRLELNGPVVESSRLTVSSKLLRLAERVEVRGR